MLIILLNLFLLSLRRVFFLLVTCWWPDKQALQNAGFTLCIYSYLR